MNFNPRPAMSDVAAFRSANMYYVFVRFSMPGTMHTIHAAGYF